MAEPEGVMAPRPLPAPEPGTLPCEVCGVLVHYERVTTPAGLPDFLHVKDDYAWLGWSWSDADGALALVATCSRACLGEWWSLLTEAGA